jgi:hypothetical protein
MDKQVEMVLADPVFDPQRQISHKFFWMAERLISAGLTRNIGGGDMTSLCRRAGGLPWHRMSTHAVAKRCRLCEVCRRRRKVTQLTQLY